MDDIEEQILKINVPTSEVKVEDIQELLKKIKRAEDIFTNKDVNKYCPEILDILWVHMERGFIEFDDELLCSTTFYTILTFSSNKEAYLEKVLALIKQEIDLKEKGMEVSNNIHKTIGLIYGIFQSTVLQKSEQLKMPMLSTIVRRAFILLTLMAYEYSQYTFLVFKILTFFKKVVGTNFQDIIFNKDYNFTLLNVINNNWENPITGVRGLNKIIFHNLISVLDEEMHEFILKKLNGFYWNKTKYLMFSEIIEQYQNNIEILLAKYDLVKGLVYSLHKPGLVSAGADMYIAIVKKLNSDNKWCTIFLGSIIETVKGSSIKPIENFNNYWCLNTFKKFPLLIRTITDEIGNLNNVEHKLYSYLSIVQQSNRLGLFEKNFNSFQIEPFVLNGLEHCDANIRILSFDILCGTHSNILSGQNKNQLILDFLKSNINSDCCILRINMIKSFRNFLIQLHMMFLKNNNAYDPDNLLTFCKKLQIYIIKSLNFNGNYQRKITTIQVTKEIMNSFKEIPRKKQKQTRQLNVTLIDYLKSENVWILSEKSFVMKLISLLKDPSEDIRVHVMDVLLHNYSDQLCKNEFIDYLIEEALSCVRSRFFYQITCGHTIFKLIVNLLLTEKCTEGQFKKVEDVFTFAFDVLKFECNSNIDIVKSIKEGKQLHSYLSILHNIFEVCLEKSYKLDISLNVTVLLEILKSISNQFVWEQETLVSSDFSKINDMVQDIIANSEHKISHHDDETNISGLHQIVLNCLWLNVKASCELASILVSYFKDETHKDLCNTCLNIICHVLETSRHKGAIEAGGSALAQAIQQLTCTPEESIISKIPMILLKSKVDELISETSNMASVTRRGAGLSIMIHRIVSSDMKKGKPLFHYFMQVLLATCNKLPEFSSRANDVETSNDKDLPKAIYIHFLTRIVTDSSLASDVMHYSVKLAEIAFDNLTSSCWQIRNAALQLYGALIPKLIGQKKKSGANEEVIATVAVDEFRTHSPNLWDYIVTQLKHTSKLKDVLHIHNNLVPILSILANIAPMYSFTDAKEVDEKLLSSLISLLGSPIYVVRRLTAKSLLNIYPFQVNLDILLNSSCETENSLHGVLMLLNEFTKQYNETEVIIEKVTILKRKYYNLVISRQHSYLCKERIEHIFPECIDLTDKMIRETLSEIQKNGYTQGIYVWANFRIQYFLKSAPLDMIPDVVTLIADCSDFENYCETLCKRIKGEKNISEKVLFQQHNILYSLAFRRKSLTIWKLLFEMSINTVLLSLHLDRSILLKYIEENEVSYRMRYMLPFAARVLENDANKELLCISNIIFRLCNPAIGDVDMRLIAATANNQLASKFNVLLDNTKINTIKAAVIFLQDEDEDIRNLSIHFYRQVNVENTATHPYICLRNILNYDFLNMLVGNSGIQSIYDDLMDLVKTIITNNQDEYNPFANDSKNIYLEPNVLMQLLGRLKNV